MKFREATEEDVELLSEFWYDLAEQMEEYSDFNKLSKDAKETSIEELKERIGKEGIGIIILEEGGEQIGYVYVEVNEERSTRDTGKYAHIGVLYIKEEYRGQGYGSKLIEKAEEWAERQGCNYMTVSAEWKNQKARNFYQKNQYQQKKAKCLKNLSDNE